MPLQPLMDNLESQTYEVFEQCSVKYQQYYDAILSALTDDPFVKDKEEVVLMVLGAGRGPLVEKAIDAGKVANKKLILYAIEKNPNAIVTLYHKKESREEWKDVTVIFSDIRKWEPSEKADIIVSELLGSFGDNELSPECLYGAQHLLKDKGISIPNSSTSYIAPISSTFIYNEAKKYNDIKHLEMGYVVLFNKVDVVAEPKECFKFIHPCYDDPHFSRQTSQTFLVEDSALIHGVAGYFDSGLYKDVNLSIVPSTHTDSLISWFPIFFPLSSPLYVPKNSEITIHFWRVNDGQKVWYEWVVETPFTTTPIHNSNGRSSWIGL
jgi:protein arginine N-methyltransferase 5